jgi:cysteine desulfuration protein SufE
MPEQPAENDCPEALAEIIALFEFLPEDERRGALINYAETAILHASNDKEDYDLVDIRKDRECTDTVGVFLKVDEGDRVSFSIDLGPQVQTLTRAMTAILCKGLSGCTLEQVLEIPADFVPRIIGAELVRIRSRTVYYVLTRMKHAVRVLLDRRRQEASCRA